MWRTLFALAHVDGMVTEEEIHFMRDVLERVPFSALQRDQLCHDMASPQDVASLFCHIDAGKDQTDFFGYARELVHADGHYSAQEQDVLVLLKDLQLKAQEQKDLQLEAESLEKNVPAEENPLLDLLQKFFKKIT